MFTLLVFFLILSILVFVHELGHFVVARWVGVNVEEFGFGLPPRIWGKRIGNTIYSINWLPIGGFVKLSGEDEEELHRKTALNKKKYFWARSKKERAAILLAGVFMNFLVAVGITSYLLTQGIYETSGHVHIEKVLAGSPAAAAGLRVNDIVLSAKEEIIGASEKNIVVPQDLIDLSRTDAGTPIVLAVKRGSEMDSIVLTPRKQFPKGEGPIGIAISDLELKKYPLWQTPYMATKINLGRAKDMIVGIVQLVGRLIRLQPVGQDVAGPIGIEQVTGQAVKFGFSAVLEFMSILSLNLAVLNVLPIPALDGGRLLFVILEKFFGHRIKPAFERSTHQIGMLVLLVLVVIISINDILRFAHGG